MCMCGVRLLSLCAIGSYQGAVVYFLLLLMLMLMRIDYDFVLCISWHIHHVSLLMRAQGMMHPPSTKRATSSTGIAGLLYRDHAALNYRRRRYIACFCV